MNIKESFKNIAKYVSLGIVGGLTLFNTAKAQSTEYKKPITEIRTEGDNIIIPENKLNEFLKNYKTEKIHTLNKVTDITLDGYVTDALTTNPLEGIKVSLQVYRAGGGIDNYGPVPTDINGYYTLSNITGINDMIQIDNIGEIKYQIINTPQIQLNLNKLSKVEIKIYDLLEQEIKTLLDEETMSKTINTNINNLASGVYILQTIIDGKPYNNKILKTEKGYNYGKNIDQITEKNYKQLNKTTNIGGFLDIIDETNTHHNYKEGGTGEFENNNPRRNLTLPPVIPLQIPFNDPEVPYPINNLVDLWKDMSRIQNENDYTIYAKTLWPIKLYIDSANAPTGWVTPIRDAIQFKRNNTTQNPDSVLQETNEYTDPFSGQNYSAVFIIYTDSTDIGQQDSRIGVFYDQSQGGFTGAYFKINTTTGMQPIDVYKEIQRNIQKYITEGVFQINNNNYLGNGIRGQPYETTPDEQKLEDMIRNMTPNIWINRFFNPGQLYKPATPNGYEKKGTLLVPKEQIINVDDTIYNQIKKELENKSLK